MRYDTTYYSWDELSEQYQNEILNRYTTNNHRPISYLKSLFWKRMTH